MSNGPQFSDFETVPSAQAVLQNTQTVSSNSFGGNYYIIGGIAILVILVLVLIYYFYWKSPPANNKNALNPNSEHSESASHKNPSANAEKVETPNETAEPDDKKPPVNKLEVPAKTTNPANPDTNNKPAVQKKVTFASPVATVDEGEKNNEANHDSVTTDPNLAELEKYTKL